MLTLDLIQTIVQPGKSTYLDVHYNEHDEIFDKLSTAFRLIDQAIDDLTTAQWMQKATPTIVVFQHQGEGKDRQFVKLAKIETADELIELQKAFFAVHYGSILM